MHRAQNKSGKVHLSGGTPERTQLISAKTKRFLADGFGLKLAAEHLVGTI